MCTMHVKFYERKSNREWRMRETERLSETQRQKQLEKSPFFSLLFVSFQSINSLHEGAVEEERRGEERVHVSVRVSVSVISRVFKNRNRMNNLPTIRLVRLHTSDGIPSSSSA